MPNLLHLRNRIDWLDDHIVTLLNRRLRLAEEIGSLKARKGDKVYNRRRERELLARLVRKQKGPLTRTELRFIYQRIIRASRAHQKRVFQQTGK